MNIKNSFFIKFVIILLYSSFLSLNLSPKGFFSGVIEKAKTAYESVKQGVKSKIEAVKSFTAKEMEQFLFLSDVAKKYITKKRTISEYAENLKNIFKNSIGQIDQVLDDIIEDAYFATPKIDLWKEFLVHSKKKSIENNKNWFDVVFNKNLLQDQSYSKNEGINRILYYCGNENFENKNPIILFLVHGTFASDSPELSKVDDKSFIFSSIKDFAMLYSNAKQRPIYVISFFWSGKNDYIHRMIGGALLAQYIRSVRDNVSEVITIAHSHGGNVVNFASNVLRKRHFVQRLSGSIVDSIDLMINIGTPVRQNVDKNFASYATVVLNFYSLGDAIQLIGNIDPIHDIWLKNWAARKASSKKDISVYNVATKINGNDPNHSYMKSMLSDFFEIYQKIQFYKIHRSLTLNIDVHEGKKSFSQLVIRYDVSPEGAIANQVLKEREFSDKEHADFRKLYGKKDINDRGSNVDRFLRGLISQMSEPIS
ncbi:TPA: hypothetical protein DEO28_02105 [Candidatus Dependentiae bacterium]|nr:MAG: hypothetical protein UR14_C0004G0103 [candidate division TM6 bacterium GW2011_GWE2_31_21]KKP53023.1 MAG: hypothetical protein UR43_C0008G0105 [candidate division TM6 bacterium GW2011_GWF2_33_332]HBS47740.1 hypothetical protein [Candidatus Dependentiae bacterium]HBZ73284.1 hypothetical protein [Candidatus Dependentiae bacterium]